MSFRSALVSAGWPQTILRSFERMNMALMFAGMKSIDGVDKVQLVCPLLGGSRGVAGFISFRAA